jgi:polyisoprenyl-teichoic acid--peptidoglycan teichoic acid transferase
MAHVFIPETPPRTDPDGDRTGGDARPPAGPVPPPPRPPAEAPRRRIGWRLLAGCSVVLLAAAAASAVFVSGQIDNLRVALSQNPSLKLGSGVLAPAGFGGPQTLLLVGNDQRNHTTTAPVLPHSNEMLLVRIDPSKPWISMMSIPRELWVPIDTPSGVVTTRFNYAYTAGGIPLLVATIRQILGLPVNHVIVIDFNQFKRAVDEMGCVYSTVDRRYFHVNTPTSEQYQEINLQPGYQKLCGTQALEFVSYRHGDTSLVRDARDQSFLLDVKREYGPTLVDNIGRFERIFGQTVQTDPGLHTTTGILNLLGTLISSSRLAVRQVQFHVNLEPSYDTATPQQIAASVHAFLDGGSAAPRRSVAAAAHAVHHRGAATRLQLVAVSSAQLRRARSAAHRLGFVLEYPRVQDLFGSSTPVDLRTYTIHAAGGSPYPAYVAVFASGVLGQYYDLQGMTWTAAPQFASPNQTVRIAGRTYDLDYSGAHLQMVAWHEHGAVYWVRNTLLDSITNGAMLAIAEQTAPVAGAVATRSPRLSLRAPGVPARSAVRRPAGVIQRIGSVGGWLTLAALPLVGLALVWWRRQLARTRAQLRLVHAQQAEMAGVVAHAAGAAPAGPPTSAPGRS